jgi:EF hand domain-containing protein
MPNCLKRSAPVLASLLLAATTSCQRGPSAVRQPSISASKAGKLAIEQYDTNGDGKIAGEELDHAPSIKSALKRLDTDGDGAVSADEVTARIQKWQTMQTGLISISFTAMLDGVPLEGATVTFEPESFLGTDIKSAIATTDLFGTGGPSIPKDQRPDPTMPSGIQFGFYRVKISKKVGGKESIARKYNEETTLGQEVATDVSEIANRRVVFKLSSH